MDLRQIRLSSGMSLEEMAEGVGFSSSTLSRLERGDSKVPPEKVEYIQKYYQTMYVLKVNYFGVLDTLLSLHKDLAGKYYTIATRKELAFIYAFICSYLEHRPSFTYLEHKLTSGPIYLGVSTSRALGFLYSVPTGGLVLPFGELLGTVTENAMFKSLDIEVPDFDEDPVVPKLTVKQLRTNANVSAAHAAKVLGIPRSSYGYMERDQRPFPEGKEQQIRDYLEYLLSNY